MKRLVNNYALLLGIAGFIVFLDQLTKELIRRNLAFEEMWAPWDWLMPYARLVNWRNFGAAFGMFQNGALVFTLLGIVVSILIVFYYPRIPRQEWLLRLALALQLGGALGNLVDRLTQGYVTDFISVGTFPVFNVADSSISIGAVLLVISVWFQDQGQQEPAEPAEAGESETPAQISPDLNRPPVAEGLSSPPTEDRGMTDEQLTFVYEGPGPQRLDKFLVDQLPDYSRSRLQGLIREGWVHVDEQPAQKTGQALEAGMVVRVEFPAPEPTQLIPEAIELDVIYEDENVLVVNKPAGMVVHPAAGHRSGTLVHAALAHAPEMEGLAGEKRPGVVHRLDKDTSGIILLAKNDRTHRWLQDQFRRREVEKTYLALVDGQPPTPSGRIEAAVGRNPRQRKQMAALPEGQGRPAVSEYFTRQQYRQHSLLEVHPISGRTHQIRVHLAFVGCPVTGDTVYGRSRPTLPLERQFLHAYRLKIRLPDEKSPRLFEAPLPQALAEVLAGLPKH